MRIQQITKEGEVNRARKNRRFFLAWRPIRRVGGHTMIMLAGLMLLLAILTLTAGLSLAEEVVATPSAEAAGGAPPPKIDTGDTAWVLASSALVLLMTPGLALFYGGMVRKKNVLGTIMQSFIMICLISIQ